MPALDEMAEIRKSITPQRRSFLKRLENSFTAISFGCGEIDALYMNSLEVRGASIASCHSSHMNTYNTDSLR